MVQDGIRSKKALYLMCIAPVYCVHRHAAVVDFAILVDAVVVSIVDWRRWPARANNRQHAVCE